jgi:hypothetical protein
MTRVYSSPDRTLVDTFRRVLESYGIAADARDALPVVVKGTIPITGLWVLDDVKADQARTIIAQAEKKGPRSAPRWKCGTCSELIDGPSSHCWQCGKRRPQSHVASTPG